MALTSKERFGLMYRHQPADRIPITDEPWRTTIERWHREGMPEDVDFQDYFGLDRVSRFGVDNSPRYPTRVLEETDRYITETTRWGVTQRTWKHATSTPEMIAHTVVNPEIWAEAKARMQPDPDRIPWDRLKKEYAPWVERGDWIVAGLWFGFDVTHSWFVGTERLLMALLEQPDWCRDMFSHMLDLNLTLLDMVWDAGYHFDAVRWPDDMGYKEHQFFSLRTYRKLLKPYHERAIEWAHDKGVVTELHSCGNITPFVPELVGIGLDGLNPLEVKAGMDPLALKAAYGNQLTFRGGINAVLWDQPEAIREEIARVVPVMKQDGGYIFSSDHSVPDTVSLTDFRDIVAEAKEAGRY